MNRAPPTRNIWNLMLCMKMRFFTLDLSVRVEESLPLEYSSIQQAGFTTT